MTSLSIRQKKVLGDFRSILRYIKKFPTSGEPNSDMYNYVRTQFKTFQTFDDDKETLRLIRQRAHDMKLMMENIERQQEIVWVLSGERHAQSDYVKRAAMRCGLKVPDEVGALDQKQSIGNSSKFQHHQISKSDVVKKYLGKLEDKIGS